MGEQFFVFSVLDKWGQIKREKIVLIEKLITLYCICLFNHPQCVHYYYYFFYSTLMYTLININVFFFGSSVMCCKFFFHFHNVLFLFFFNKPKQKIHHTHTHKMWMKENRWIFIAKIFSFLPNWNEWEERI